MVSMIRTLAAIGLIVAAVPAGAADRRAERGEADLAKLLANRVAGKPVHCVDLRDIGSSQIFDGTAIVYERGNKIYVNRPSDASSLDSDDILVTRTLAGQLCRYDSVRLVARTGGFARGFAILGDFVPYAKPPKTTAK